jgi:formamidopyrimidine-DNA glycosylase
MIELPEATVIAAQIAQELTGKRVVAGDLGTAEHKWAFTNRGADQYASMLADTTVTGARPHGSAILVELDPDLTLVLGGGGERILYHAAADDLPAKRHLTLRFDDGSALSMAVQGWGARFLLTAEEFPQHSWVGAPCVTPLDKGFTETHFVSLFQALKPDSKLFLKKFLITEPGVPGLGNGYLQDILFHARIHYRRRAAEVTVDEGAALAVVMRNVLSDAVKAGGRDTEKDLYGHKGSFRCLLDTRTKGTPCSVCATTIEKSAFLGGSCYFCPTCQT